MTRKRRLKRKTPLIICGLILLAILGGGYVLAQKFFGPPEINQVTGEDTPSTITDEKRLNVLLLGIDAREGETMARTDSVILASMDPKSKQMALLSIPRDTRVKIPGHGWDKINSASVYGGPETSMKVVSELLGIPVDNYVLTNFSGFKDIVDALGGVTIDVERNMYHPDITDGGAYRINLKKGVQRLDGDKALQYVRYRNYEMGDIDRTKYQQKFLAALAHEMLLPSTIPKLPKLVPEINRYVKTNLSLADMYKLAMYSRNLENGNILTQTLPGRPVDIDGGSYWGVNPIEARQVVTRLFNGETVTNVVLTTPLSSQYLGPGTIKSSDNTKTEESPSGEQKTQGTISPAIPGVQTAQNGKSGSGSKVTITPVDTDEKDTTGTEQDKTSATKETSKESTYEEEGYNPSIPGTGKTGSSI